MDSRLNRESFINAINNYEIAKEAHDKELKASKKRRLGIIIISPILLITIIAAGIYQFVRSRSYDRFFEICENGTPHEIWEAVNRGIWDVNYSLNGETPLSIAISHNPNEQAALVLIRAGAFRGWPRSLEYEIRNRNFEVAEALIRAGIGVNEGDNLRAAIEIGNLEIVEALIHAGAKVNEKDLNTAIEAGNPEIVRNLIIITGVNVKNGTLLITAIEKSNSQVVKMLIDAGADVNKNGILQAAIERNNLEVVKTLVEAGINLNQGKALAIAAKRKNIEIVKALIAGSKDKRVSENVRTNVFELVKTATPIQMLEAAVIYNAKFNVKTVGWPGRICDVNTDVNTEEDLYPIPTQNIEEYLEYGTTPLFFASAFNKNPESIKFLIDMGLDVNAESYSGGSDGSSNRPLANAIHNVNTAAIRELLNAGADPNIGEREMYYPLSPINIAVSLKNRTMAKNIMIMLIKAGADINYCFDKEHYANYASLYNYYNNQDNRNFRTAYSISGYEEMACADYGPVENSQTPLMKSVLEDKPDEVNLLLDFKADPNIHDVLNNLALDYALELPKNSKLKKSSAFKRLRDLTTAKTGKGVKVTHSGKLGVVKATKLNVRDTPSTKGKVKFQIEDGDYVKIEDNKTNSANELWYYIMHENRKGWVLSNYIR